MKKSDDKREGKQTKLGLGKHDKERNSQIVYALYVATSWMPYSPNVEDAFKHLKTTTRKKKANKHKYEPLLSKKVQCSTIPLTKAAHGTA